MGADQFMNQGRGKTAQEAFDAVTKQACYDYGHAGYTGTIAEKHKFVMIPQPNGFKADAKLDGRVRHCTSYAKSLIERGDRRVDDKCGPAGCIDMGQSTDDTKTHEFLFFGWASS